VIAKGVHVGGVAVGGLTKPEAAAAVRAAFAQPLRLVFERHRLTPTPATLGATALVTQAVGRAMTARPRASVALPVRVHGASVREYVAGLAERWNREAVDSRLFLRRLTPVVTKDRSGLAFDRKGATRAIVSALVRNRRATVTLHARTIEPKVTRDSFGSVIVIRRGSNLLTLYDGMKQVRQFGVATGQARYPTPLGRFEIVVKWENPWWYPPDSDWAEGQEPVPPGPGNPLGTRWMGISSPGVGIHGTPDGGSIGYSVSHGCIRMQIPEAEWLFGHVSVGTPVFIVSA
jgi:lipoprotein-anchoring transpeptidase ErfK/SrfK